MSSDVIAPELTRLISVRSSMRTAVAAKSASDVSDHTFSQLVTDIGNIISLPREISRMASGTTTQSVTSVEFSMTMPTFNAIPELVIFYTTDSTMWANTPDKPALLATIRFADVTGASTAGMKTCSIWRNADGSLSGGANPSYGILTDPVLNQFVVTGSSSAPIVKDVEYKYIAIRFN